MVVGAGTNSVNDVMTSPRLKTFGDGETTSGVGTRWQRKGKEVTMGCTVFQWQRTHDGRHLTGSDISHEGRKQVTQTQNENKRVTQTQIIMQSRLPN